MKLNTKQKKTIKTHYTYSALFFKQFFFHEIRFSKQYLKSDIEMLKQNSEM